MKKITALNHQKGAALIVALVLLTAITVVGLANIQSSTIEARMVSSQRARITNFAAAEQALSAAENDFLSLYQRPAANPAAAPFLSASELFTDVCLKNNANDLSRCFEATCAGGFCFDGLFNIASTNNEKRSCEVGVSGQAAARTQFWLQPAIWNNANTHRVINVPNVPGFAGATAQYIAEFMCFVSDNIYDIEGSGTPLYRITVLYSGDANFEPIMLQSTYSIPLSIF